MITESRTKHLDTREGVAEAFRALVTAEQERHLPRPIEAHPVPRLNRVDVHLASDADLAAWAAAFGVPVIDHDAVHEIHLLLAGHLYDLWALADGSTR